MVQLNSRGEVADFWDVNQFQSGRSAFECCAYAASLCKYCGEPGHGPSGTVLEASNQAQYFYGLEEGSNLASNTNGMSLQALYNMLQGMRLSSHVSPPTLQYVKAWLGVGYPVLICGAETGMYDIGLGDVVPYSWEPTGNHCIVASGIAPDGNLLVHDTANIGPTGVRPGPRIYDAAKLQLVSATAIAVPWLPALPGDYDPTVEKEVEVIIDLSMPEVATFFSAGPGVGQWTCKQTGKIVQGAILAEYCRWGNAGLCGLSYLGLPESNEIPLGNGVVKQNFQIGVVAYDPGHTIDNRPGLPGAVYPLQLYNGGPGEDPQIAQLKAQITAMQKQQAPLTVPSTMAADMQLIKVTSAKY